MKTLSCKYAIYLLNTFLLEVFFRLTFEPFSMTLVLEVFIRVIGWIVVKYFGSASVQNRVLCPHWFLHNCKSIFKSGQIGCGNKVE